MIVKSKKRRIILHLRLCANKENCPTNDLHGEDGLGVGRRLAGLLLLLELGEGAQHEGEGGEEHHAQTRPSKHLIIITYEYLP